MTNLRQSIRESFTQALMDKTSANNRVGVLVRAYDRVYPVIEVSTPTDLSDIGAYSPLASEHTVTLALDIVAQGESQQVVDQADELAEQVAKLIETKKDFSKEFNSIILKQTNTQVNDDGESIKCFVRMAYEVKTLVRHNVSLNVSPRKLKGFDLGGLHEPAN